MSEASPSEQETKLGGGLLSGPGRRRRTFVLVGKAGAGKSSTGNLLLGHRAFRALHASASVTRRTESAVSVDDSMLIIDTPGLGGEEGSMSILGDKVQQDLLREIGRSMELVEEGGGVTAFLLVLSLAARITEEDVAEIESLGAAFGPDLLRHAVVVWTHADFLGPEGLEGYLEGASGRLLKLLDGVGRRQVLIDNTKVQDVDSGRRSPPGRARAGSAAASSGGDARSRQIADLVQAGDDAVGGAGGLYDFVTYADAKEEVDARQALGMTLLGPLRNKKAKRIRQLRAVWAQRRSKAAARQQRRRGGGGGGGGARRRGGGSGRRNDAGEDDDEEEARGLGEGDDVMMHERRAEGRGRGGLSSSSFPSSSSSSSSSPPPPSSSSPSAGRPMGVSSAYPGRGSGAGGSSGAGAAIYIGYVVDCLRDCTDWLGITGGGSGGGGGGSGGGRPGSGRNASSSSNVKYGKVPTSAQDGDDFSGDDGGGGGRGGDMSMELP